MPQVVDAGTLARPAVGDAGPPEEPAEVLVDVPQRQRLAGYRAQAAGQPGWDWFFPGAAAGQPLTLGNVYKNFRRFLWRARISHGGPGQGPRVHDLRH